MKIFSSSLLYPIERRVTKYIAKYVPPFIGTKSLTFLSLVSSFLIFISYYLSVDNHQFFLFATFFIVLQWIFDILDGEIGRQRKEGFVKWGYYMDHLFDYFFMSSIVFGLSFVFPIISAQLFLMMIIFGGYMISYFLFSGLFIDKKTVNIAFLKFSPIEFRLMFIAINIGFFFAYDIVSKLFIELIFVFNIGAIIGLILHITVHHRRLSEIDLKNK